MCEIVSDLGVFGECAGDGGRAVLLSRGAATWSADGAEAGGQYE